MIQSTLGLFHHETDVCKHSVRLRPRSFMVAQFLKHKWTVIYGLTTDTRSEPVVDHARRIAREAGVETIGWSNEDSPIRRIDFLLTVPKTQKELDLTLVVDPNKVDPHIDTKLRARRSTAAEIAGNRQLYVPAIPTGQFEVNTDWHLKYDNLECEDFERLDLMSQ